MDIHSSVLLGSCWTELSVLGSQLFEQASAKSCGIAMERYNKFLKCYFVLILEYIPIFSSQLGVDQQPLKCAL